MAAAQALLAQSRALYLSTAREYLDSRDSFVGELGLSRMITPKYVAVNNAIRLVDYCMEIVGAHGFLRRSPLERMFRDVRAGVNHPLSNARAGIHRQDRARHRDEYHAQMVAVVVAVSRRAGLFQMPPIPSSGRRRSPYHPV